MFRCMISGLLLLVSVNGTQAQTGYAKPTAQTVDNFYVNQGRKVVGFRLPANTQVNDVIYMTRENGVLVKKTEVTKAILASGQYEFSLDSIPAGAYLVSVASNSHIKYRFTFISTAQITAAPVIPERKVPAAKKESPHPVPVVNTYATTVLTFNPQQKQFTISSDIPFREGSLIEVFNEKGTLLTSREVTADMLKAKTFPIRIDQLTPGTYYVSVDDVKFGSVTYSE